MTRQSKALVVIPARSAAQRRSHSASDSTGKLPLMLRTPSIATAVTSPACHKGVYARLRRAVERSEFARASRKFPVRGRLHESEPTDEPVETPPHPDPLPASGEREQKRHAKCHY